jgi:hypothetical protein
VGDDQGDDHLSVLSRGIWRASPSRSRSTEILRPIDLVDLAHELVVQSGGGSVCALHKDGAIAPAPDLWTLHCLVFANLVPYHPIPAWSNDGNNGLKLRERPGECQPHAGSPFVDDSSVAGISLTSLP